MIHLILNHFKCPLSFEHPKHFWRDRGILVRCPWGSKMLFFRHLHHFDMQLSYIACCSLEWDQNASFAFILMVGQIIDWHVSVQLSLVALYLNLDLDFLVACRTTPNHSWRNPVERLMSIINLGFQSVGLMHSNLSEDFELKIQNCNSLKELRAAWESSSNNEAETLQPVIDLLSSIVHRLQVKKERNSKHTLLLMKLKPFGRFYCWLMRL